MNFKDLRAIVKTRKAPNKKLFFFKNNELCSEVVNDEITSLWSLEDLLIMSKSMRTKINHLNIILTKKSCRDIYLYKLTESGNDTLNIV